MKTFVIASALTILAGSAFAQEAPFQIVDGEVVATGQVMPTDTTFSGSASASASSRFMFDGGNINSDENYSGR